MHKFQVGDRVVCVDDYFPKQASKVNKIARPLLPKKGDVYTIRSIFIEDFTEGKDVALHLEEIINPQYPWRDGVSEIGFVATRFKPVKKTDISIFTAMLNPTPQQAKELEYVDGNTTDRLPEG